MSGSTNTLPPASPVPTEGMAKFVSNKVVLAGRITEVVEAGCYVANVDGTATLRPFKDGMTARYMPVAGDFWIVYPDGYESISPRLPFLDGYQPLPRQ